jgi:hypothetical protein
MIHRAGVGCNRLSGGLRQLGFRARDSQDLSHGFRIDKGFDQGEKYPL